MRSFVRSTALVLLVVAALSTGARADAQVDLRLPAPALATAPGARLALERKAHDARVLRNAGIVSTVLGTVVNLVGVGVMVSNLCFADRGCPGNSSDAAIAGAAMIGVGYAGIFAGIPMWAVGGTRLKHAKLELGLTSNGVVGRF